MTAQPLSILIAALGGEGGGVLVDWLVASAMRAGLPVQATSVPGVAQRTGATSYYFECLREPVSDGRRPVFALMPVPGLVDVLLASELLEAGRMIERGYVSPQRTLLLTASHRVLTTAEKMQMADGRYDEARLHAAGQALAHRYLCLDLRGMAERHRTAISAVMFGALAGSGVLPWTRQICEEAIREGGVGVDASLAGFAEAFDAAAAGQGSGPLLLPGVLPGAAPDAALDAAPAPIAAPSDAPAAADLAAVVELGMARALDYQDRAYAQRYRARVDALSTAAGRSDAVAGGTEADPTGAGTETARQADAGDREAVPVDAALVEAALVEAARQLALWMAYEDVVRVADLKCRPERHARIRAEAGAGPHDLLEIREHFSPKGAELAAIAPLRLGRWLRARTAERHPVGARGKGLALTSNGVIGFALLRSLAALKRFRPSSLRFHEEQAAIDRWLAALARALPLHPGYALALAGLPRLRKGYSDTWARGVASYDRIFTTLVAPSVAREQGPGDDDAVALRQAIAAALADPEHKALDRTLAANEIRRPVGGAAGAQPVVFHRPARRDEAKVSAER